MYYLTDEDYATAEANGIPRNYAYHRYYSYKWDKDRALTEPITTYIRTTDNSKHWEDWKEIAELNGITKQMFFNRLNKKAKRTWTPEEAASTPKHVRKNISIHPSIYKLAEKNGIGFDTLRSRVYVLKWNPIRAATEKQTANLQSHWNEEEYLCLV